VRCLMVRVASRAISAWVTPSTRFALVALLRWWAWPMMRTATGSRGSAAPESGHVATPSPRRSGDGGSSLVHGCQRRLAPRLACRPSTRTSALLDNGVGPSLHPETHSDPNLFAAKDPGQPSIARCPLAAGVEERPADATDKSHRCFWGFPDQRAWTADSAVKRAITLTSLRAKTASSRRRYRCDRYRIWEHHHTYYDRYFRRGSDRRAAIAVDTNNVAALADAGLCARFVTATCRRGTVRRPTLQSHSRAHVYQQCFPTRTC